MKREILIMGIILFLWITYNSIVIQNNQCILETKLDNIENTQAKVVLSQSKNDSLFMVHLSKCSFISDNRIKVGFNGYLKLKKPYDR